MPVTVAVVALHDRLCILGTEISARLQNVLMVIQVVVAAPVRVVALVKVFGDSPPEGSVTRGLVAVARSAPAR